MGKICSLIMDGGNCTYVASQRLIEKLALKTFPHPRPYKLQWLSENRELVVDIKVLICFSIGKTASVGKWGILCQEPNVNISCGDVELWRDVRQIREKQQSMAALCIEILT